MSSTGYVDKGDETVRTMQGHFNTVLQKIMADEQESKTVRLGLVPPQRFPSGIMAFEREEFILDRATVNFVHVNFALGTANKVKRLKAAGMWSVSQDAEELMAATRAGGSNASATAAAAQRSARRVGSFWGREKEVVNAAGEQLDMTAFVEAARKHAKGGVLMLTTMDGGTVGGSLKGCGSGRRAAL